MLNNQHQAAKVKSASTGVPLDSLLNDGTKILNSALSKQKSGAKDTGLLFNQNTGHYIDASGNDTDGSGVLIYESLTAPGNWYYQSDDSPVNIK
jgi:hypothetical protein